jgi:hypothetical protein
MSVKIKALPGTTFLRTFADLPKDAIVAQAKANKPVVVFDPGSVTLEILETVTETLELWLRSRFADLRRENVSLEDIVIQHHGGRTTINVCGVERFSFKLKVQMEGK